jgi:4-hydroxy-3-methylbut-2-enyl diphosphate reductase
VIVVGGHNSNNTRQLVLAAEAAGVPAKQIAHPDELEPAWLEGVENVGLTAGTSTLKETVAAVQARLESIVSVAA